MSGWHRAVAGVAAVTLIGVVGCADDGPSVPIVHGASTGDDPTGVVVEIRAVDNTFDADRVTIAPGTTVTWINAGHNDHDVLAIDGVFGVDKLSFRPGQSYSHVFDTPGEYPYYCELHGIPTAGMIGVVVVEAPTVDTTSG